MNKIKTKKLATDGKASHKDASTRHIMLDRLKKASHSLIEDIRQTRLIRYNLSRIHLPLTRSSSGSPDHQKPPQQQTASLKPSASHHLLPTLKSLRCASRDSSLSLSSLDQPGFFSHLQSPVDFHETKNIKTALLKTLRINREMKDTLESFYTSKNKDMFERYWQDVLGWDKRMQIANRQSVLQRDIREELLDEDLHLLDANKKPGLFAEASTEQSERDYYFKAQWLRPEKLRIGPFSCDAYSRMLGTDGCLKILTKNNCSLLLWRVDPVTGEASQQVVEVSSDMDRYHFSACLWGEKVVVFGGQSHESKQHPRYINHDVLIIDADSCDYQKLSPKHLEHRRGRKKAAAAVVSNVLVVHGGFDASDRLCRSLQTMDLETREWRLLRSNRTSPALESHCMAVVLKPPPAKPFSDISSNPQKCRLAPTDGIYLFGGLDEHRSCSDKLLRLRLFTSPAVIEEVRTAGRRPAPRHSSSLHHLPSVEGLALYGGRSHGDFMSDVFVFDLGKAVWVEVKLTGRHQPEARCCFSAYLHQDDPAKAQLFVFGGIGASNFVGGSVEVLDLDTNLYSRAKQSAGLEAADTNSRLAEQHAKLELVKQRDPEQVTENKITAEAKKKHFVQEKTRTFKRSINFLPIPVNTLKSHGSRPH